MADALVFTDSYGRRCRIATHTLADLERNYHPCECQCALCAQENDMPQPRRPQPRRSIDTFHLAPSDEVICTDETGQLIHATGSDFLRAGAGDQLHRYAKQYQRDHPGTDYRTALHAVGHQHPRLVAGYVQRPVLHVYDAGTLKAGDALREAFELPEAEQRQAAKARLLAVAQSIMDARNRNVTNDGSVVGGGLTLRSAVQLVLGMGSQPAFQRDVLLAGDILRGEFNLQ